MENICIFFCLSLLFFSSFKNIAASEENDQVYIVYMGGKGLSSPGTLRHDQEKLINSLSQRNAVVHVYKHGFTGFAAYLSKEEANVMAKEEGVVSVFPDQKLKLRTTRSWYFLSHQNVNDNFLQTQNFHSTAVISNSTTNGADTIIGLVDGGITPESKSFSDKHMGPVPARWKGTCQEFKDFPASSCNRKIIGARNLEPISNTSRDLDGHGTHTSSTAAGAEVAGASYYGLGLGTAVGGSPGSRIASYKACVGGGCLSSAVLAGMDIAIKDGVDILSLSLGADAKYGLKIFEDAIAIGAFHAVEHGITVVCAAGNDGPFNSSVSNFTPWITTVAASTIDRHFAANVVLGNNRVIKGGALQFSSLDESPKYPLTDGISAKNSSTNVSAYAARNCELNSLDKAKIKGKIVLCYDEDGSWYEKTDYISSAGGIGLILVDDELAIHCLQSDPSQPATAISSKDAKKIISYIRSNRNPTATIHKSVSVLNVKPAPIIADFSSRGPSLLTHNLLKPDISAPGVNILAAWSNNSSEFALPGQKKPDYVIVSGTSMACPHISGIAALVKSQRPTWDPSAIRSAIMTTALQTNNLGRPITKLPGQKQATPYDFGAGEVNPLNAVNPGLVYETKTIDYYLFLCNFGYNLSTIKLIAKDIPEGFSCPKNANKDLISNMNYPSIAVANFKKSKKVTRTLTNVGEDKETVYSVKVDAPKYLNVKVIPEKLHFTKENKSQSFQVIFTTQHEYKSDVFGWITWSNDKYKVRSPFAVSI